MPILFIFTRAQRFMQAHAHQRHSRSQLGIDFSSLSLSLRNMIRLRNHISSLICCLRCRKHNKYSIESYRFGLFDAIFPSPVAARMIFFQFSISSFLLWMFYSNGNSSPFSGFPSVKLESRENFKNLIEKFFCRCCCCCCAGGEAKWKMGNYNSWRKALHQKITMNFLLQDIFSPCCSNESPIHSRWA